MATTLTLEALAERLDRLESKEAIRDIVTAYAIACDEHGVLSEDRVESCPISIIDRISISTRQFVNLNAVRGCQRVR